MRQWPALPAAETGIDTFMVTSMPTVQIQRIYVKLLSFALALGLGNACHAHAKICSPKEAEEADAAVDHLDNWTRVERALKKYGHCDDGSIAEGNSEAVARLLVDGWTTLPLLAELVKRDPALRRFVLCHIDATLDTNDLSKIVGFASMQCPTSSALLCNDLLKAAARASQ